MKSKALLGIAVATTAACVATVVLVNTNDKFDPVRISADPVTKTLTLAYDDLSQYTSSAEGDHKLRAITMNHGVGTVNDYSFRINLGGGKYVNGLLLYGDCGHQDVHNLGSFTTSRNSGGVDYESFNYNILLSVNGLVSASMDITMNFPGAAGVYTGCTYTTNITYSAYSIFDNYFDGDDYSKNLHSDVNRDATSYYDLIWGHSNQSFAAQTTNENTGKQLVKKEGGYTAVFRINGLLDNDPGNNSIDIQINSLSVEYTC